MDAVVRKCPNEIYQHIASYLEQLDRLSFALVHPIVYRALGKDSWSNFRGDCSELHVGGSYWNAPARARDWAAFLDLLKKTWPQFWYCSQCRILHRRERRDRNLNDHGDRGITIGPVNSFQSCSVDLRAETVRSVLDRHFLGTKHGSCKEVLRVSKSNEHKWHQQTTEMNSFAEFRGCELIWQATWDFSWYGEHVRFGTPVSVLKLSGFRFCQHLVWTESNNSPLGKEIDDFIDCRMTQTHRPGRPDRYCCSRCFRRKRGKIFHCTQCATAFDVQVIHRRRRICVTFQVNKNFGSGEHRNDESAQELMNHFADFKNPRPASTNLCPFGLDIEPLFFECGDDSCSGHRCSNVLGSYTVKQCEHEARDLLAQGKKPVKVDPAKKQIRARWLQQRALGYDDDYFEIDISD